VSAIIIFFFFKDINILNQFKYFILFQGFGVAAKNTTECKHTDPLSVVCFNQADIGEFIRCEDDLI